MKNVLLKSLVIASFATLTLSSCKKNKDVIIQPDRSKEIMSNIFKSNEKKFETFAVNAANGGIITTSNGTKINFSPASFVDESGNIITGDVQIKVLDILKPSDMIFNNKPTSTSDGGMLQSFGEIKIDAKQGDKVLKIRNDEGAEPFAPIVRLPLGVRDQQKIPIWAGTEPIASVSVMSGHNHINEVTTVSINTVTYTSPLSWNPLPLPISATSTTSGSVFPLDSLNTWRNCDALNIYSQPKTTVLGYFGSLFNAGSGSSYSSPLSPSMLFFKVRNQNTLIKIYTQILNPAAGKEGFLSYQNSMPIGLEGTFLAISSKNNKLYAEMKDLNIPTPESGKSFVGIDFNLSEVSETEMVSLINLMNTK